MQEMDIKENVKEEVLEEANGGGSSTWDPVDLICKNRDKGDHCPEQIKKYDNCFGCIHEFDD